VFGERAVLADARRPRRTEPASVYHNADIDYGPIDERVIAYVLAVLDVLLASSDAETLLDWRRPRLDVWRDTLSIIYPDGSIQLECSFDDESDDVATMLMDNTATDVDRSVYGVEDDDERTLEPRACAEHMLDIRRRERTPHVGVLVPANSSASTRMCRLSSLGFLPYGERGSMDARRTTTDWACTYTMSLRGLPAYALVVDDYADPATPLPYNARATALCRLDHMATLSVGYEVRGDAFIYREGDGQALDNGAVSDLLLHGRRLMIQPPSGSIRRLCDGLSALGHGYVRDTRYGTMARVDDEHLLLVVEAPPQLETTLVKDGARVRDASLGYADCRRHASMDEVGAEIERLRLTLHNRRLLSSILPTVEE